MNNIKYFLQFILIIFLFSVFKIIGARYSSILSGIILRIFGPLFRSKKICHENLKKAFPFYDKYKRQKIINKMWFNYGKIFAEYMFIKNFRNSKNFSNKIIIQNPEILKKIKNEKKPVIFISGHFSNFELMAMQIEKVGIDLSVIYRPLNNKFLNPIMEKIRKKYICKNQIKKGVSGTKELLINYKKGSSIALMIDQRVSEGIAVNFFNHKASTTTIPAQFVKKFGAKIIPVYIERINNDKFKLEFYDSITFNKNDTIDDITLNLNQVLEKMILRNPSQWIWTHNRWK